jgi:Fe-S oxidoreductase
MDTPKGERFSELRLAQAQDAGARVLATSCPYCITMLESSLPGGDDDAIKVRDITEILREAI